MNQNDLIDIYGHWHVPFWQTTLFKLTGIILVSLILGGFFVFRLMRWYKKRQMPASQKALNALNELQHKVMQSKIDTQKAYYNLTDILKTFFQSQFGRQFVGMTDEEMRLALQELPSAHILIVRIDGIINGSIGVKYAQESAAQSQLMEHIDSAKIIIQDVINQEKIKE